MTYLPNLIKRIDSFYQESMMHKLAAITKVAAPDYFEELDAAARTVEDPGLGSQLQTLAELYRYALSMGGGYATIARVINNVKNMYSDGTDSEIEDILNGMLGVLTKEAGGVQALAGNDNPRFKERLMQLKSDIDARSMDSDAYNNFQDESHVPGAREEGEKELGQSGLRDDTETVSPAALGLGNKEDPKVNRGWHRVGPSNLHKDWKEYYANEVNAYNIQLAETDDPAVKNVIIELIKLIPQVSELAEKQTQLKDYIKMAPQDEPAKKEKADVDASLTALRSSVTTLRNRIRSIQLKKGESSLQTEIDEATKRNDLKAKELAEQKLALNRLSQSSDYKKSKERNLRLNLIRNMSGGNFPGMDTLLKEKARIEAAKTERIPKEVYDREITEERGKQQAREITPDYEPTRGGGRVPMARLPEEKQINLEKASFSALVYQFQIDIASATQAARQAIYETKKFREAKKVNATYKGIIDEVSAAIRKKDRPALYAAQNKLIAAVANDVNVEKYQLKGFVDVIQLEPHFRKILESIKELTKKGTPPKLDESGNLITTSFTDQDKRVWSFILNDIHRLKKLYAKYYIDMSSLEAGRGDRPSSDWWRIKRQITPRFKYVIEDMGRLEIHLALFLQVHRPKTKERYPERSPMAQEIAKKQKEKMKSSSIVHRMILLKIAQEAAAEQEIDKATADKLANDFFDKVLNEEYQKMFSELQV